jgi:hypothetical protein
MDCELQKFKCQIENMGFTAFVAEDNDFHYLFFRNTNKGTINEWIVIMCDNTVRRNNKLRYDVGSFNFLEEFPLGFWSARRNLYIDDIPQLEQLANEDIEGRFLNPTHSNERYQKWYDICFQKWFDEFFS